MMPMIFMFPTELLSTSNCSTQCDVDPVCAHIMLMSTYFSLPQPSVMLVQCVSPYSLSTFILPQPNKMLIQCMSTQASVNLFQPASAQCGVDPVCVPIELLSTQCGVGPVCVPHRAILNPVCWSSSVPLELSSTQ